MRRIALVLSFWLLPAAALAQTTPDDDLVPDRPAPDWTHLEGEQVRLGGFGESVTGRVERVRGDTLMLASEADGPVRAYRIEPGSTVERWVRRDRSLYWSLGLGMVGAAAGMKVGMPFFEKEAGGKDLGEAYVDALGAIFLSGLVGATVGVLAGKAIGSARAQEGWRPVRPVLSVQGFDSERGLSLGITLRH